MTQLDNAFVTKSYIQDYVSIVANQYEIPQNYFHRLINSESSYNPNAVGTWITDKKTGKKLYQAKGIAQFIPPTAKRFGINPFDWKASLNASAQYLKMLHDKYKDWNVAVGYYKGANGSTSYALKELNKRDLILKNGTVIPPVTGNETSDKVNSDSANKLTGGDTTSTGDSIASIADFFTSIKELDFPSIGFIAIGVVLIIFTLVKKV